MSNQVASDVTRSPEVSPKTVYSETTLKVGESQPISIRLPKTLIATLKEFAKRENTGYQVLMKKWIDQRIMQEREKMRRESANKENKEV